MLTTSERDRFETDGFLIKEGVFSTTETTAILDAIMAMTETGIAELRRTGWRGNDHAELPVETRLARIHDEDSTAAETIIAGIGGRSGGGYHGPAMLTALRNDRLLEIISDLVGPQIIGSSVYRVRTKLPHHPKGEVPWHQDSGYLLPHCDRHRIITAWVPLVDANAANGCMFVVPGMHREPILTHRTGGPAGFLIIDDERLEARRHQAVCAACPAGSVVLMTNLTPHASFTNRTNGIRWSIDLRYQGAEVPHNANQDPLDFQPTSDPVTMACYPTEADFVLRDPIHPEREVRTAEAFAAIRAAYDRNTPKYSVRRWQPAATTA
ncbi:hypothetical protein LBMAG53_03330 [Planctomycetota bacterium]|nr:hypothetical protein LBMAG53_03330 [Planctomycetota bacterium]